MPDTLTDTAGAAPPPAPALLRAAPGITTTPSDAFKELLDSIDKLQASLEPRQALEATLREVAARYAGPQMALWEVDPVTGRVKMMYWLEGSDFVDGERLCRERPEVADTWKMLCAGFEVPERYLGALPGSPRRQVTLIDHICGSGIAEFDRFALAMRAPLELNAPVFLGGVEVASLTFFRGADRPFEPGAFELAEQLCVRIALALAGIRLANAAGEQARLEARQRELERAHAVMQRTVQLVKGETQPEDLLKHFTQQAATEVGARAATLFLYLEDQYAIHMASLWIDGAFVPVDSDLNAPFRAKLPVQGFLPERLLRTRFGTWVDYDHPPADDYPESAAWHHEQDHRFVAFIPIAVRERALGFLGLAFPRAAGEVPARVNLSFCELLASQAAQALLITEAQSQRLQSASLQLRTEAAEALTARHVSLTRTLQNILDVLAGSDSMADFVPAAMEVFSAVFPSALCGLFEHPDDEVRLLCWSRQGRLLEWDGVVTLAQPGQAPQVAQSVAALRAGFVPAPDYLGSTVHQRTRPALIDHQAGSAEPRFDALVTGLGCRFELNVPLLAQGRAFGALAIYRAADAPFTDADIAQAEIVSQVMSLALRGSHLAAASQQRAAEAAAAAAREIAARDQLRELTLANDRLRRVARDAARGESPDRLVERMVIELGTLLDAHMAAVFTVEPGARELRLRWLVREGALAALDDPAHTLWRDPIPFDAFAEWSRLSAGDEGLQVQSLDTLSERLWKPSVDWHRSVGNRALAMTPLVFGDEILGFLGFGFHTPTHAVAERTYEGIRSLLHQMALVLRLQQMAGAQTEAALSLERQRAAERRVEDLASANAALKHSLTAFSPGDDVERFLPLVTLAAQREAGAVSNAVFTFDPDSRSFSLGAYALEGTLLDVGQDPRLAAWRTPVPWEENEAAHRAFLEGTVITHDVPAIGSDPLAWPRAITFHQAMGHGSVLCIPMRIGTELLGFMGLCFMQRIDIVPSRVEMAYALTLQATVALFVSRRAEAGKAVALQLERQRLEALQADRHRLAVWSMQQLIDSLDDTANLADMLPRALAVVASVFEARSVGVYEIAGERIFLRHLWHIDRAHSLDETAPLTGLAAPLADALRWLARGFEAPDEYLGDHATRAAEPVFIDHVAGTCVPRFDEIAALLGPSELNVPIRVAGLSAAALVIYRAAGARYSPDECALAEMMARQLSLALRSSLLAREAREEAVRTAVAIEQAEFARLRLEQLSRANAVARDNLNALGRVPSVVAFLPRLALTAQEQASARSCALFVREPSSDSFALLGFAFDGAVLDLADDRLAIWHNKQRNGQLPVFRRMLAGDAAPITVDVPVRIDGMPGNAATEAFHRRFGHRVLHVAPLSVQGETLGFMALGFGGRGEIDGALLELTTALALQGTLALWVSRRAETEASLVLAHQARAAAESQAAQHAWAISTLQASIDALGQGPEVERYIPTVSGLVAQALSANAVAVYRVHEGICRLQAGWLQGRPMRISDIRALDPDTYALMHSLADGFELDERYTGGGTRVGSRSQVFDHTTGSSRPEFDAFLRANGWSLELNVPLIASGELHGALCVYRPGNPPYNAAEVSLAESVATQVSLALRAAQMSEQARDRAIEMTAARERASAARERARELAAANLALKRGLDALSGNAAMAGLLSSLVPAMLRVVGAVQAFRLRYDPEQGQLRLLDVHNMNGQVAWRSERQDSRWLAPVPTGAIDFWIHAQLGPMELTVRELCRSLDLPGLGTSRPAGRQIALSLPMRVGKDLIGLLVVQFPSDNALSPQARLLAEALALEVTLAMHLTELNDRVRQVATLQERNRLARDMHDTLAQGITGILIQLGVAEEMVKGDEHRQAREAVAQASALARSSLTEARRVVRALRSPALVNGSLPDAVAALAGEIGQATGLPISVRTEGVPHPLDAAAEEQLLRIAQESLVNVARHAHAERAWVDLRYLPGRFVLEVRDNGRGWVGAGPGGGFGLVGIRERVASIGAEVVIEAQPGLGAWVRVELQETR